MKLLQGEKPTGLGFPLFPAHSGDLKGILLGMSMQQVPYI